VRLTVARPVPGRLHPASTPLPSPGAQGHRVPVVDGSRLNFKEDAVFVSSE